ncbi:hypothetical protein D9757_012710 [Collybiopsis confluens]|uniref:F-box domain-containing protein n=1 Tax=Collybiopsis confluens TaxID=2823264 RepID=A0A8H5HG39_9AGAR|nr:hypothetical protein D9757_012710 [Collybiopsis confluens]
MDSLPPELIDDIFLYLAGGNRRQHILSLSLVSQILAQRSRPLLFHTITIRLAKLSKLFKLLENQHQTISKHIRRISIDGQNSGLVLRQRLPFIFTAIGNKVDSLSLINVPFHVQHMDFLMHFPAVRFLEISDTTFVSVSQAMSLLSCFRLLRAASLTNIYWNDPSSDTAENTLPFNVPASLDKLSLESCYKRDVMECLLSLHPPPLILDLSLGLLSPSDVGAIGRYISYLGARLKVLSVGFSSLDAGGDAEDFYVQCPLSMCTGLESIHFEELVFMGAYRLTNPCPWIAKILSALRSPVLARVSFSIHLPAVDSLSCLVDLQWSDIDQALAQALTLSSCLERVQLRLRFDGELEADVLDAVREDRG